MDLFPYFPNFYPAFMDYALFGAVIPASKLRITRGFHGKFSGFPKVAPSFRQLLRAALYKEGEIALSDHEFP